jgi:hypothetical protein
MLAASRASKAIPPTTPPTMAPIGAPEDGEGDGTTLDVPEGDEEPVLVAAAKCFANTMFRESLKPRGGCVAVAPPVALHSVSISFQF